MKRVKTLARKIMHRLRGPQPTIHQTISVGILYLCTGKYELFFDQFYKSFEEKFLPGLKKTYFVFTDSERVRMTYSDNSNIHFFSIEHKGWPLGTLLRNRYFYENFEHFAGMDYLFFCNANLVCKAPIYLNELGLVQGYQICGVQHPYFFQKKPEDFIVEKTKECHAYFSADEIKKLQHYYQGCFYGGTHSAFKELVKTIYAWTEEDLAKEVMPVWLDESYLNRYFFVNKPFPLHSGFAYPEFIKLPFRKTIVQLDKAHRDSNYFKRD